MSLPREETRKAAGRRTAGPVALRFIGACVVLATGAMLMATGLFRLWPPVPSATEIAFPPVFGLTTLLLVVGSGSLQVAVSSIRRERQRPFRRALLMALSAGALFVGIQGYGIAWLIRNQRPDEVALGVNAFATCLTALHAMHFTLAMMLLIWVTLQAFADRYDHEYYWGVTICSWFWHALGVVWMGILVVFAFSV